MELSLKPASSYRRFRNRSRYDAPFLWGLFDLIVGLTKIAIPFLLIAIVWQHGAQLSKFSSQILGDFSENLIEKYAGTENEVVAVAKGETFQQQTTTQNKSALPVKTSVATASPIQAISGSPEVSRIVNQQWILEQSSDKFTIQFGTSPDSELLLEFVPLIATGSPVSIFPFKRTPSGRLVFGISTGLYSTLEEAATAVNTMPAAAQEFDPWIRPLGQLKRDILNTVNVPG